MKTELMLIDLHDTMIPSCEITNATLPPKGLVDFLFENSCVKGIRTVATYEREVVNPRYELESLFYNYEQLSEVQNVGFTEWFSDFLPVGGFVLNDEGEAKFFSRRGLPKNFLRILHSYHVHPDNAFVVGDDYYRDICGAELCGIQAKQVNIYDPAFSFLNIKVP